MSTFFKINEQDVFYFSLSPTGPLAQVPRCSIDGELCRNQEKKKKEGVCTPGARGRFWDGTPLLVPVFGISNENWTWPYKYQTKQEIWE